MVCKTWNTVGRTYCCSVSTGFRLFVTSQ